MNEMLTANSLISHYRILSRIGAGGMGEIYLAEDTRLGRKVALKLLSADLTKNEDRLRRFEQEARAASTLSHPNILTIHDIGRQDSVHFIATEFIDGETLRQRMSGAQLGLRDTLEIAIQVASALDAAHIAGVVHRDIKPENVMVRPGGYVKVLDFGLAKLTESLSSTDTEAPTVARVNTDPGTVMGTVNYMSPEQARGKAVDARTDIFSLGVMLYEMAAGRVPFEGETPTDVISSIINREPPPLARYSKEAPEALEWIVTKALRKDRDERYQTAKELFTDLRSLKGRIEFEAELERSISPESFIAKNSGATAARDTGVRSEEQPAARTTSSAEYIVGEIRRHKKGAGLVAAGLVVAAAAAIFLYFNRATALTERDTVVLADFVNTTGDPVFDGTLKQALAVQLGQSPFVNILSDERVREALRFMGRSPDDRVTREIAREICERQGLKALLAGSISNIGSQYIVLIEAVNGGTGDSIAREQVEAGSKEQVLASLGKAASKLREKLGESLASIQKFDAPIEQATTSSLEALKAFSLGHEQRNKANNLEAIPFYKRAIELDPNFALAYVELSVVYNNSNQLGRSAELAEKAFALRDRVSEREKLYISSQYYGNATLEIEKDIEVLELWKHTYPRDHIPHNVLSVNYLTTGQYEKALEEARETIRLNPNFANGYSNLANAFISLNRFEEAKEIYHQASAQKLDTESYHGGLFRIAFIEGDQAAMQQQIEWAKGRPAEFSAQSWQAEAAAFSGQLQRAKALADRAVDLTLGRDLKEVAATFGATEAERDAILGDCKAVREKAGKALAISRCEDALIRLASALAECGDPPQTQLLIEELTRRFPKDTLLNAVFLPSIKARLELTRGNSAQVIQLVQAAGRYEPSDLFRIAYLRAQAYLHDQKGAEATAEFQKILDHRGLAPMSPLYPLAQLGLARAASLSGDTPRARKGYQDFFALWRDADADLPILIEARNEYERLK